MKKLICFLCAAAVAAASAPVSLAEEPPEGISAEAYIVTDDMGGVVFSRSPDKKMQPASTAKLLTALVAVENAPLEKTITVKAEHTATEGSMLYLRVGETLSLSDLLYGLLLASGNDAALAVAELVSGSTEDFVGLMNAKAAELGMDSSRFSNPSGLPDEGCYTTARDMAKLIAAFAANETAAKISGTRENVCAGRTIVNHNRLLNTVAGVDCGKTGYTKSAGRCLVTTAKRMGRRIYVVTFNAPDDWADHAALYGAAFARYGRVELGGFLPVAQHIVGGTENEARITAAVVPEICLTQTEREALYSVTYMRRFEYAPARAGDFAGRTEIYCGEKLLFTVKLYFAESVASGKFSGRYLSAAGKPG